MLLQAQLPSLALISSVISSANTSAPNGPPATSDCVTSDINIHPNASNFYAIPAVMLESGSSSDSSSSFLVHSNDETWQIANILGQTANESGNSGAQVLENSLYLNMSSGQNASMIGSVVGGCSVIFRFPQNDLEQSSSNGDCASIVGSACVNDVIISVQQLAASMARNTTINLQMGCDSIKQGLMTLPNSCTKSKDKNDASLKVLGSQSSSDPCSQFSDL